MHNWDTILESQSKLLAAAVGIFFEFLTLLGCVFQDLKVCVIKIFKIERPDLLFLVTSADIIFSRIVELYSILYIKKIFITNLF